MHSFVNTSQKLSLAQTHTDSLEHYLSELSSRTTSEFDKAASQRWVDFSYRVHPLSWSVSFLPLNPYLSISHSHKYTFTLIRLVRFSETGVWFFDPLSASDRTLNLLKCLCIAVDWARVSGCVKWARISTVKAFIWSYCGENTDTHRLSLYYHSHLVFPAQSYTE